MNPTGAANSDSTPHSTRSTPQPRPRTAGEPMALPELDVARVQRWCAARVPEHARHKSESSARSPHDTSPSSSGALPGARTSGRNGPTFRSPVCATPPPTSLGPCTGATATSASTSTTYSHRRTESTTCSPSSTATPPASSGSNSDSRTANWALSLADGDLEAQSASLPPRDLDLGEVGRAEDRAVGAL